MPPLSPACQRRASRHARVCLSSGRRRRRRFDFIESVAIVIGHCNIVIQKEESQVLFTVACGHALKNHKNNNNNNNDNDNNDNDNNMRRQLVIIPIFRSCVFVFDVNPIHDHLNSHVCFGLVVKASSSNSFSIIQLLLLLRLLLLTGCFSFG